MVPTARRRLRHCDAVFDLRYHVASLTAVFIALVIGILVGIGLSGKGFVDDAERTNLEGQIADLRAERDTANELLEGSVRGERAMQEYANATYPALVPGRLKDRRVAVLYVGSVEQTIDFAVHRAVREAGGRVVRVRALRVPLREAEVERALATRAPLKGYAGQQHLGDLGRDLGRELAAGGKTPLWDALTETLVEERDGPSAPAVDAIVVSRPAPPQRGATKTFLAGLYRGVARSGVPSVGVEVTAPDVTAVTAFHRNGLSTVDGVDTPAGQLALVLLLSGAQPGSYGVGTSASDGVLPPVPPPAG